MVDSKDEQDRKKLVCPSHPPNVIALPVSVGGV